MVPGVPAFLCIVSLIILWATGWFSRLRQDLKLASNHELFGWLLSASAGFIPEIPLSPAVIVHPGMLWLMCAFLRILWRVESIAWFSVGVALSFFGSTFFLAKELALRDPVWVLFPLQGVTLALLIGLTLLVTPRLNRRLAILLGGMLLAEILGAWLPPEPAGVIRIGSDAFWDALWLSVIALTSLHYALLWAGRTFCAFREKLR